MRIEDRQKFESLLRRVDVLEKELEALKAKKRPGRPRKDANDG